jgi:hypothetical protein
MAMSDYAIASSASERNRTEGGSQLAVVALDPTAWYFPPTPIFALIIAGLTVFGIATATDQKLLPSRSKGA